MAVGWIVAATMLCAVSTCGSKSSSTGASGAGGTGASGAAGPTGAQGCPDLFDQATLRTYAIEIAPDEWNSIQAEFHDLSTLVSSGNDFVSRHAVVFHMGSETVSDATFKLHGQSSWAQTAMLDGDRQKMQFDISFHEHDPHGKFHGIGKLVFDMPRSDWTFLHDRLAHAWLRQSGIAAGCAASARVEINGAYYGLFVAEETTSKRVLKQFFPDHPDGDLWKGAIQPETNQEMPDWTRQMAFSHATDIAGLSTIVDLQPSVTEWAAEALLNNADGTYGGWHNLYLYDTGPKGLVYLPNDTDSTFDWLAQFDSVPADDHPIYWWERRAAPAPVPAAAWLAVMNDPTWRGHYVDAIAAMLAQWDVAQIQG